MELLKNVANAPNWVTGDKKLSRAGAFLWVFTVLHALPNFLLLSDPAVGLKEYQGYADNARAMMVLPVFEIYLAVSLLVHAFLAAKKIYTKGSSSIGWLATTGAVMLFFLITHLLDFRFAGEAVLQDLGRFMPGQSGVFVLCRCEELMKHSHTLGSKANLRATFL